MSNVLFGYFDGYKMSMGFYNGEKLVVQLRGCYDLHMADGEFMLKKNGDR